jgi:hypothetical protein
MWKKIVRSFILPFDALSLLGNREEQCGKRAYFRKKQQQTLRVTAAKFFSLRIAKNDFQSIKDKIIFFQNAKADKAKCKTKQSEGTAYEHPFPVQFTHETGCSGREQGETFTPFDLVPTVFVIR